MPAEALVRLLESARLADRRVVFTNGCFDVLHAGHVDFLARARALGDLLVVGINDDASITRLKGEGRPVNPIGARAAVLGGLLTVDYLVGFAEDTPGPLIELLRPDVLVKGEDWKDKGVVGREFVESYGGEVVLLPLIPGLSTTSILRRLEEE
ncbi:MAG: D-glycero-beta-D-manno-heptose 1-phosphate adenylyltransferase [Planctomycetota bacterium]